MAIDLKALIRTIPDFPKPGIQFRDITTLLLDPAGLAAAVDGLAADVGAVDVVAGIEARGFVFGAAVARQLNLGFLLVRKDGKLPGATVAIDYALEYGTDRICMHEDALVPGARVLLIDDVLATGGTLAAARELAARAGWSPAGIGVVLELQELGGRARLEGADIHSLLTV